MEGTGGRALAAGPPCTRSLNWEGHVGSVTEPRGIEELSPAQPERLLRVPWGSSLPSQEEAGETRPSGLIITLLQGRPRAWRVEPEPSLARRIIGFFPRLRAEKNLVNFLNC